MHAGLRSVVFGGSPYDPDVNAWAAAAVANGSAPPSAGSKALLTTLVRGLKGAGVWSLLDGFLPLGCETQAAALVDLKSLRVATMTGAGFTFTANRGLKGPGAAVNWINTNFNPTVGTNSYVRDSNCKGVYIRTGSTTSSSATISQDVTLYDVLTPRSDATNTQYANNAGSADLFAHSSNITGAFCADRSASNLTTLYRNGSALDTFAGASGALNSVAIALFAYPGGGNYDDAELSAAWYGASLGATGNAALNTHVTAYLQAIGAA